MSITTGPLLGVFDTDQKRLIGITQNGGITDITYLAGQDTPTPAGAVPVVAEVNELTGMVDFVVQSKKINAVVPISYFRQDTDPDDTLSFQRAFASGLAHLTGHGQSFVVSEQINVPSGKKLFYASIKVKDGSTAFDVFYAENVSDVEFSKVEVDLNKANVTASGSLGRAFYINNIAGNTTGNSIKGCKVKNGHVVGIHYAGHKDQTNPDNLLDSQVELVGNDIKLTSKQGILITGSTDSLIERNRMTSCGGASYDGIQISVHRGTRVKNNRAVGSGRHGITLEYGRSYAVKGNIITGSVACGIANGGGAIGYSPNRDYVISGNQVTSCGAAGIQDDPGVSGQTNVYQKNYGTISNNSSANNGGHGIYAQHAGLISIIGNVSHDNALDGIAVNVYAASINGNTLYKNRYGLNIQGGTSAQWVTATSYPANTVIRPTAENGLAYQSSGGTSGVTEPTWPTTLGATVTDNGITWTAIETVGFSTVGDNIISANTAGDVLVDARVYKVSGASGKSNLDVPAVSAGATYTATVACNGATLDMGAVAYLETPISALIVSAFVSARNVVTVQFYNPSASAINPALSVLRVRVFYTPK